MHIQEPLSVKINTRQEFSFNLYIITFLFAWYKMQLKNKLLLTCINIDN